jgi:LysR family positive regulator for ilvC
MAESGLSRQGVEALFKKKGVHPNIYAYVAGNEAIISMVSLGCGVGVVPRLVLEKSPLKDQVRIMDVKPELSPFSVGVCTAKKNLLNPIVSAFWEIAEQGAAG